MFYVQEGCDALWHFNAGTFLALRTDQDVGVLAGSTTSPLPGQKPVRGKQAIWVPLDIHAFCELLKRLLYPDSFKTKYRPNITSPAVVLNEKTAPRLLSGRFSIAKAAVDLAEGPLP